LFALLRVVAIPVVDALFAEAQSAGCQPCKKRIVNRQSLLGHGNEHGHGNELRRAKKVRSELSGIYVSLVVARILIFIKARSPAGRELHTFRSCLSSKRWGETAPSKTSEPKELSGLVQLWM